MTATLEITADDALRSIKRKSSDVFDGIEVHPAANLFPMMGEQEFAELKADIEKHGQREPIVYWRGQLLDGRNRLRACRELRIQPSECELDEENDPIAFVLSANLHRRHLTTAQRAMIAAKLKGTEAKLAKDRQKLGKENLPDPSKAGQARDKAGELLKVSGRTVDKAEKILASGSPELIKQVEAGEVSIDKAARPFLGVTKPKRRNHRPKSAEVLRARRDNPAPMSAAEDLSMLLDTIDKGRADANKHFLAWVKETRETLSAKNISDDECLRIRTEAAWWDKRFLVGCYWRNDVAAWAKSIIPANAGMEGGDDD